MDINETIKKATAKSTFTEIISKLKHSQLQAQTYHRQTKLYRSKKLIQYCTNLYFLIHRVCNHYSPKALIPHNGWVFYY